MKHKISVYFFVFSLFWLQGVAAQGSLDLSQMQNVIPGKTAYGHDVKNDQKFRMYFGIDHVVTEFPDEGPPRRGKWRFKPNGHLCIDWDNSEKQQCLFLVAMGGGNYQVYNVNNQLLSIFSKLVYGRPPELREHSK
jgi:hypothetical protein